MPNGGIRGDHVLLIIPVQINRLDKAQVEGRGAQVAKNVSYTGFFLGMLASLAARALPIILTKRLLVVEMDSIYTKMINAIEYRNVKAMVSI